jgi:hypothetical protein
MASQGKKNRYYADGPLLMAMKKEEATRGDTKTTTMSYVEEESVLGEIYPLNIPH